MHLFDWLIVGATLLVVAVIGLKTQKYVKTVSDFLAAGRVAGRYVLAVASGEAGMGLISMVAMFELYYHAGFAGGFWNVLGSFVAVILALSGFCFYRFRETRAMTMGQFFEIRYSKSFRIFAAILQSISGILNYAIFPAVGSRFLIYFCGLPVQVEIFDFVFPTFMLMMMAFLSVAVIISIMGGQVTIMVTDCVQGILSYPMYLIVVAYILYRFSWFGQMAPTLLDRLPGKSMLNPYDIAHLRDFNLFFVLAGIFGMILNRMGMGGGGGYNSAAATAHERKIGNVLSTWRNGFSLLMMILLAIAAYTYLNHKDFRQPAAQVRSQLASKVMQDVAGGKEFDAFRREADAYLRTGELSVGLQNRIENAHALGESKVDISVKANVDPEKMMHTVRDALKAEDENKAVTFATIFNQMRVPMALSSILPIGITGIFCSIMIFLLISTDTTYLHSWGTILIQDLILPFRRTPFTPKQQLRLLRLSIVAVAVFAFMFSSFFGQIDYILMYFQITGAIWLGGAGPCIVLGLYWKRGTTVGAFASVIVGSFLSISGILLQKYWVSVVHPWLVEKHMIEAVSQCLTAVSKPFNPYIVWDVTPDKFPINSMELYFMIMLLTLGLYVGLSLLTCRKPFNMNRMLHRGKYRREGSELVKEKWTVRNVFNKLLGIDSEYSKGDKVLAWSVFLYSVGWGMGSFFVLILWNKFSPWPNRWWANWFFINNIVIAAIIGLVSTFWFAIGGTLDLCRLFKRLKEKEDNVLDDGRVLDHVSSEDVAMVENVDHIVIEESHKPQEVSED